MDNNRSELNKIVLLLAGMPVAVASVHTCQVSSPPRPLPQRACKKIKFCSSYLQLTSFQLQACQLVNTHDCSWHLQGAGMLVCKLRACVSPALDITGQRILVDD
ncbi:unnamed protein product [Colias eurytheme]|nr:unnamed protein product [Colias eurytheme]